MKNDSIIQDIKVLQTVVKEVIGQNPDASISIINIGQIQLNNTESQILEPNIKGRLQLPKITGDKVAITEELQSVLEAIIDQLPEPRQASLTKLVFVIAGQKFSTTQEAADWIGISTDAMYNNLKKMGLPTLEKKGSFYDKEKNEI